MKNALGKGQFLSLADRYRSLVIILLLLPFASIAQSDSLRPYIPISTKIRYTKPIAFEVPPVLLGDTIKMALRDTGAVQRVGLDWYTWRKISGVLKWWKMTGGTGGINSIGLTSSTITVPPAPLTADGNLAINLPPTGVVPGAAAYPVSITFDIYGRVLSWTSGPATVPAGRTLTINGVTYDLTSDRNWTISGSGGTWGTITGTLSSQADLQAVLNGKYNNPTGTTLQYIRGDGTLGTMPTGQPNTNAGSGWRLAIANTNQIKTIGTGYGIVGDSATTGQIGLRADTADLSGLATKPYARSLRDTMRNYIDTAKQILYAVEVGDSIELRNELGERVTAWIKGGDGGGGVNNAGYGYIKALGPGKRPLRVQNGDTTLQYSTWEPSDLLALDSANNGTLSYRIAPGGEGEFLMTQSGNPMWGKEITTDTFRVVSTDYVSFEAVNYIDMIADQIVVNGTSTSIQGQSVIIEGLGALSLSRPVWFTSSSATDANFNASAGVKYALFVLRGTLTANRTLTLPSGVAGEEMKFIVRNTGAFQFNLAGATVNSIAGSAITSFDDGYFHLVHDGLTWVKVN